MNTQEAKSIIQNYINGWKEGNVRKILESLTGDCEVIESHGPVYKGLSIVEKWVQQWIQRGNIVTKWDITSFYFVDNVCFFEWQFSCIAEDIAQTFDGASIAHFKDNKIVLMREYRTTVPLYNWKEI